jgi:O-antigen/teichoic acid export membrane protein
LVFFIFLARFISQAQMGVYAALLLAMSLFQIVGLLGLQVAAARFIPKSVGEKRSDQVSMYVGSILIVSFVSAIGISVAFYFLAGPLSFLLTKSGQNSSVFRLASLAVLLSIPAANLDAVMQGLQSFGKLAAVRVLAQALRVGLSVLLLVMGYALTGVIWGYIVVNASLLLVLLWLVGPHLRIRPEGRVTASLLEYSFPLLLSNLATFFSSQADVLVLMILTIPKVVGIYQVALTASLPLNSILIATIATTVQPAAAKVLGSSGKQALESALKQSSRYLIFVYLPAAVGLAALGGTAISLMAGQLYLEAVTPLAVISIASIASALSIIPIIALQTVGDTRSVLTITILSVLVGVAADAAFIPVLGGLGAALGRATLMLATLGFSVYLARRHVSLSFDLQALRRSLVAATLMGAVLIPIQAKLGFAAYNAAVYIPVGIVVFLLGMRLQHAFRPEDLDLLLHVLPSRLRSARELFSWAATE